MLILISQTHMYRSQCNSIPDLYVGKVYKEMKFLLMSKVARRWSHEARANSGNNYQSPFARAYYVLLQVAGLF